MKTKTLTLRIWASGPSKLINKRSWLFKRWNNGFRLLGVNLVVLKGMP